jgi:biopolymer transport protein ExbD
MRTKRSIRNRRKRDKKAILDLDITSLLDILVIMLVFLLKSYNSSGIVLNVPKSVTLPSSNSQSINTTGVMIQVSPDTIWVDNKIIWEKTKNRKSLDQGGRRIIPLYNELVRIKRSIKRIEKSSPNAKKFSGVINLIVDKSLKYNWIKKLLYTSAEAGYRQYKFVVLGEDV